MKTLQMTASAVALGALALSAGADTTAAWWNLNFNDIDTSWTGNVWEISGAGSFNRSSEEDVSAVTSRYKDEELDSAALELNTNGGDLVFAPGQRPDAGEGVVVDADVFFIASEQDPTITEVTGKPVQAALYLYASDNGDTPQFRAYSYGDSGNEWVPLSDFPVTEDNLSTGIWRHVQITYAGRYVTYKIGAQGADLSSVSGETISRANSNVTGSFHEVVFKGTGLVDNFVGQSLTVETISYEYVASVVGGTASGLELAGVEDSTASFYIPLLNDDENMLTRIEVLGTDGTTVVRTVDVAVVIDDSDPESDPVATGTFTTNGVVIASNVADGDTFGVDVSEFIASGAPSGTQFTVLKLYYGSSEPPAEEEWGDDPAADQTKLDTELASGFTAISEGGENPVEFDAQAGFTVKFVPSTPGLYELIAVSSVDADFSAGDSVDSQTVSAADVTAETPVELSDATTAGSEAPAARFYKIKVSGAKE